MDRRQANRPPKRSSCLWDPPELGPGIRSRRHKRILSTHSYRQISIVWPLNGGAPYLHLCDEQHGHRLLSATDLNALAAQTEPTDAAHLREALRLLSAMAEQIERA